MNKIPSSSTIEKLGTVENMGIYGVSERFLKVLVKRKVAQNGSKMGKCFTKCFTKFYQKARMVKQW